MKARPRGYFARYFFLLFPSLSISYSILVFGSHHPASDLDFNDYLVSSTLFFSGCATLMMGQHPQAGGGESMARGNQLEAEGLQQIECTVAGSGAGTFYDVILGSLADCNLSASMGPPLPKRQIWASTVTVASLTVQEPEAITPKPEGGVSVSKKEITA